MSERDIGKFNNSFKRKTMYLNKLVLYYLDLCYRTIKNPQIEMQWEVKKSSIYSNFINGEIGTKADLIGLESWGLST